MKDSQTQHTHEWQPDVYESLKEKNPEESQTQKDTHLWVYVKLKEWQKKTVIFRW